MKCPPVSLIASLARHRAIGLNNQLLWRERSDLQRFKRLTMGHAIVMGRKTWESLGRPLPGRRNIVITANSGWHADGAEALPSLEVALERLADLPRVFVIGGASIYGQALPRADRLELTEIDAEFKADTFFPAWNLADFTEGAREAHTSATGVHYSFVSYERNTRD